MSDAHTARLSEPRPTPLTAAARHPFLTLLPVILLAALGAAAGLARTPTYSAEARVSVTRLDVQTQALPGYAQAAVSLASAYARNVEGTVVQDCVSRRTKEPAKDVSRLSGSPVPESPVIRVLSEASSASGAERLADAGAACLVENVSSTGARDTTKAYLKEYAAAARKEASIRRRLDRLDAAPDDPAQDSERNDLESQLASQRLVVSTLGQRYTTNAIQQRQVENVAILSEATPATSDKLQKLAIFAFSGAVVGLLLGLMLASLRLRRGLRKHGAALPREH